MKRFLSAVLVVLMIAALLPAAYAAVPMSKIYIRTYNDTGAGNDVPRVGQNVNQFTAQPETAGFIVSSIALYDMGGAQCTGRVENQQYVLNVNITVIDGNYYIDGSTTAFINGVQCSVTPGPDGMSATISRNVTPKFIDPTIWKHPGDENHDKSKVFSFAASASPLYTQWQWTIMTTYGEKFTPEEFQAAYPGVGVTYHENSGGGVTLNISNPIDDMSGWLVYCGFKGESGAWVYTNKAQMTIKDAVLTPTPTIEIVEAPEEKEESKTTTTVDGLEVPEGVYIVETPEPTEEVIATPEPATAPAATPEPEVKKPGTGLKILKGVGIALGSLIVLGGIVIFIQYEIDKKKRKRRAKLSGRNSSGKF